MQDLVTNAALLFQVTVDEIVSPAKHRDACTARQAIAFVARKRGVICKEIAWHVGNRDHSTVVHAQQRAAKRVHSDSLFARKVMALDTLTSTKPFEL